MRSDFLPGSREMRWTLTSPDGIGDFILRLPWLLKMQESGWKLQLVARPHTLELAALTGLTADFVELAQNPYSIETKCSFFPFKREIKAIRKFCPELLFFGPSNPTFFEEKLVGKFSEIKKGGFFVDEEFWPSEGLDNPRDLAKQYQFRIPVRDSATEFSRNEAACRFLLGREVSLEPFLLPPEKRSGLPNFEIPDSKLGYIAICPGSRRGDYFKGWGVESWTRELKMLEKLIPHGFVFIGADQEMESNAEVFRQLQFQGRHINLTGRTNGLAELLSVLCKAKAFFGKDGGSMHLATICDLPVLAVFGGGHGDRFFSPSRKSTAVTVDVPCRGCNWRCHLPEHVCVSGIPEGTLSGIFMQKMQEQKFAAPNRKISADDRVLQLLEKNPGIGYAEAQHELKRREQRRLACNRLGFFSKKIAQTLFAK